MSNLSENSTESEDGEIERPPKRVRHGPSHADESRYKRSHVEQIESDENSDMEFDDDSFEDVNEDDGLNIKPPQAYSSTKNRSNRRKYDDDMNQDSRFRSNSPPKRRERHKERHHHRHEGRYDGRNEGRYSDNKMESKRFRDESYEAGNSRQLSDRRRGERWMVLDDNQSKDRKTRKDKNSHRHKHSRMDEYEDKLKLLRHEKKRDKQSSASTSASASASLSTSSAPKTQLQGVKKLSSLIEVQEVEMSEEELKDTESENESEKSEAESENQSEASEHDEEENETEDVDHSKKDDSQNDDKNNANNEKEGLEVEKEEQEEELPPYYPAIQGCRSVEEFQCINRIEEGTYGVVYRARDKRTNETVALKRLKMEKEKEGFPITSLREINTLLKAQHQNIVTVREIVVGSNMDKIYIVMDFVEHDLKSLMETMKQPFLLGEVKTLMIQLLRAVAHLHDNWILHRDLKTSNLLLSHTGILKVGDFGLAREYGSPLKPYTPIVVTLWYRAPELLLQAKEYSFPIDNWSVGCIFGEFLTMKPLFQGKSEIDQLNLIFKDLGTPNEKIWPGYSELPLVKKVNFAEIPYNNLHNRMGQKLTKTGLDLLIRFLTYCPGRRITAEDALKHEFFKETPLPVDPSMFPTWPAKSEGSQPGHGVKKAHSPKPPSGGKQFAKLAGDDDDKLISGFHMGLPIHGKSAKGGGFNLKF